MSIGCVAVSVVEIKTILFRRCGSLSKSFPHPTETYDEPYFYASVYWEFALT